MTLTAQLKKLKDPERNTIVYDLYRILMNAEDGYLRTKYLDGAEGASKVKLDKILASVGFNENWNQPNFAKELLAELGKYSDWHRSQNKPKDPHFIQMLLEDLFSEKPKMTDFYPSFSARSMVLAEPEIKYGKAK